jgi:hypothetical protein
MASLAFIETSDDDDVVVKKVNHDDDNGKYDQLSQLSTGWNVVVFQEKEYDADDDENDIKV